MALFLMNPYTVASLGVLGVPPKIGCAMHTLEPLCPTVAAVSFWMKHKRGFKINLQVTDNMKYFLEELENKCSTYEDKLGADDKWHKTMNQIEKGWALRQRRLEPCSERPCATDPPTPESKFISDVFVLALLGQSMLKQEQKIWGLPKSPKDIWCECVEHCCMPPIP